mgnify:CR=1 FL=1
MLTRLVLAVDRHVTGAIWTVAALLLAVLALIGGFQVFTRFVWNQPSPWTEELIGRLFAWCVMLGIVAAFRQGALVSVDLMLRLIEERLGRHCMTEVACWFQHPFVRDEDASQKVPVARTASTADRLTPPIREAIRLFETHVEDPLRIPDVAAAVSMSGRHFERLFKRETGQSPLRYYRHLRLAKARQRVLYSNDPLREIAAAVGYLTPAPMARHYQELFGVSPKDERRLASGLSHLSSAAE